MSYPEGLEGLEEFSTKELLDELKRRRDLRAAGLCDYCERPIDGPMCRFSTRHIGDVGSRENARLSALDVVDEGS